MKKILILVQLLVCLLTPTAWAMSAVVDEAQLLSREQEQQLVVQLEQLEQDYGIKAAIVTLPSLSRRSIGSYADYLIDEKIPQGTGGTLVLVQVVDARKWYISTDATLRGTLGSAEALENFSHVLVPALRQGDYMGAYTAFIEETTYLANYYQEGASWEKQLGLNEPALIFALFGAFIIMQKVRKSLLRSMDNVQEAAAADDYLKEGSFQLLEGRDDYMYSNTVRTPRRNGNNRNGGSSSGGHGGGGGSY